MATDTISNFTAHILGFYEFWYDVILNRQNYEFEIVFLKCFGIVLYIFGYW